MHLNSFFLSIYRFWAFKVIHIARCTNTHLEETMPCVSKKGLCLQYDPTFVLDCVAGYVHAGVSRNLILWASELYPHPLFLLGACMLSFPWSLLRTKFKPCKPERVVWRSRKVFIHPSNVALHRCLEANCSSKPVNPTSFLVVNVSSDCQTLEMQSLSSL